MPSVLYQRCGLYTSWEFFHDFINTSHKCWAWKSQPREAASIQNFNRCWGLFGDLILPTFTNQSWQSSTRPCTTLTIHPETPFPNVTPGWEGPWCHPSFLYRHHHRHPSSSSVEANSKIPSPRVKALKLSSNLQLRSSNANQPPSVNSIHKFSWWNWAPSPGTMRFPFPLPVGLGYRVVGRCMALHVSRNANRAVSCLLRATVMSVLEFGGILIFTRKAT